jgi:cob(I)alamin adenosyltransferase
MNKKIKSPSQLFEEERLIAVKALEEFERQKELDEQEKELNKKIKSPKEIFKGSVVEQYIQQQEEEQYIIEEEIVIDPIQELQEKILSIPLPKYYDEDIKTLKTNLKEVKRSIPEFKEFDPSDLYEKITSLRNLIEKVRSEIPEQISYDDQLIDLAECIITVKESIPEIPEIKYYDDQLDHILTLIENVRNEIPVVPEIRYYDKQIRDLENKILLLPEVKYYDEDIQRLEETIDLVKSEIPEIPQIKYYDDQIEKLQENIDLVKSEFPEVKYYDQDIQRLQENIDKVKSEIPSIPEFPEVKYYDKDIQRLEESIDLVKSEIPVLEPFPKVKYYDEDIQNLTSKINEIQDKLISHKIKEVEDIKNLYDSFNDKGKDIENKISYFEEVLEKFNEETLINESIINEPPETKTSDPLTPLDQNFVTLDQLKEHYRLFINRIQQQLASLGGGGETRLEFLDDIDRDTAKTNNYYLKYDASLGKWIGDAGSGGGGGGSQTLDQTLILGNTSSLGMNVGVITASSFIGNGSSLTNLQYSTLSGIATYASVAGVSTYSSSAGIATYASVAGVSTLATTSGYASTAGISTVSQGLVGTPNITVGIITATSLGLGAGSIISEVVTTTTITETSISSLNASVFRSATYQIQVTEGSNYNMTTINVIHDGSTTYMAEYGTINQPVGIATFSTDIDSGFLRLLTYPSSSNSTTFKVILTAITT